MIKKFGVYFFLVLAAFLSLFPFYFMFVSGTNTNQDILSDHHIRNCERKGSGRRQER